MSATAVCDEAVTREHIEQPCEKPAVAMRYDPEVGNPYPVCIHHTRRPMVPLALVLATEGIHNDDGGETEQ